MVNFRSWVICLSAVAVFLTGLVHIFLVNGNNRLDVLQSDTAHPVQLYADASSPLYLEPYRHEDVEEVAWKWAANVRTSKTKQPITNQAPVSIVRKQTEPAHGMSGHSRMSKLAETAENPCPWYGCADGSHPNFSHTLLRPNLQVSEEQPASESAKKSVSQSKPSNLKKTKLLAHGYGTKNAFTAQPLNSNNVESSPGTSQSAISQTNSVDMGKAFDFEHPTSFDSIPLASSSTSEARVALAQPAGDGLLSENNFRSQTLSGWRDYEHGLSQCFQAIATVDPSLKDNSCPDVDTAYSLLKHCMSNHKFGLSALLESREAALRTREALDRAVRQAASQSQPVADDQSTAGDKPAAASEASAGTAGTGPGVGEAVEMEQSAWDALPVLVSHTYLLKPGDYSKVYEVLQTSAVFDVLWRLRRLHQRCAQYGTTSEDGVRPVSRIDDAIADLDARIRHLRFLHRRFGYAAAVAASQSAARAAVAAAREAAAARAEDRARLAQRDARAAAVRVAAAREAAAREESARQHAARAAAARHAAAASTAQAGYWRSAASARQGVRGGRAPRRAAPVWPYGGGGRVVLV